MLRTIALIPLLLAGAADAAVTLGGYLTIAGDATDLSGISPAFGGNRQSIGSDLFYDRASNSYWGNTDRGPGGGVIDFAPRVHQFGLDVAANGGVSNYVLLKTVVFKRADGTPFTGLNPRLAPQGDASVLGNSFDPEGLVVLPNGNFLVADEYGPSVYEFDKDGTYVRAFAVPANLVPRQANGTVNYVDGRNPEPPLVPITSGRQDNRGYEGLTLSVDGKYAWAVLQDPLVNEGDQNDGRRSRNVRVVKYDVDTGESVAQYVYQLEARADINDRLPGSSNDFGATAQGRNIGLSGIVALPNGKFLVIERDNRGWGVEDATGATQIGSKRVWLVDFAGATDVSGISMAGSSTLPGGVIAASKSLWLDVDAELKANGVTVAEKIEGLAFGPVIGNAMSFILVTDNDFSVTQTGSGLQLDVCSSGIGGVTAQVALGDACPTGQSLIPTFVYGFRASGQSLVAAGVPEPASWALMIAGFGLVGAASRRRRAVAA